MNKANKLIDEAYNEVMREFHLGDEDQFEPSAQDISMGTVASQLAQAKGELSTLLDRASRQGIIKKNNGKISIINKEAWLKAAGNLPQKIKKLQQQLTPDPNIHADETNFQ